MTPAQVEQSRFNMIEQQIRPWDVLDMEILDLLGRVKREDFLPPETRELAFVDTEIPLIAPQEEAMRLGKCMLPPRVEARTLQDVKILKHESVLEIGTGSGYMAALLAHRARSVLTLEIDPALARIARSNLQKAGLSNVEVRDADGASGAAKDGPFDVIVLSGSVASVPDTLLAQLKPGGRLFAIVGQEPMMRAHIARRVGDGRYEVTEPWDAVAPRLQNFPEPSRFQF